MANKKYTNNTNKPNNVNKPNTNNNKPKRIVIIEEETEKRDINLAGVLKENKKEYSQGYEVVTIINEDAVMTRGLDDKKLYSKPNNNYRINDIIE